MSLRGRVSPQGRIQDFKLGGGGAHLKKLRRAKGVSKIVGVFRVTNHDFTPKNHIFSNCVGRRVHFWGISCEKSRFYAKKSYFFPIAEGGANIFGVFRVKNHDFTPKNHIFFNFRGHAPGAAPPPPPPLLLNRVDLQYYWSFNSLLPKNNIIEYPQTGPPFHTINADAFSKFKLVWPNTQNWRGHPTLPRSVWKN